MTTLLTPTQTNTTGGGSLSIAKPTGTASGDLLLIFAASVYFTASVGSIGTVTGFADGGQQQGATHKEYMRAYWREADGTEGSTFSVPFASSGSSCQSIFCLNYSGSAGIDPSTLSAGICTSTGSTTTTVPSITLVNTGDWLALFVAIMADGGTTAGTITTPSGYAAQSSIASFTQGSCAMAATALDNESAQGSGATGSVAVTHSASHPQAGILIGVQAGVSGSATLTVPGLALSAPSLTPGATAQQVNLSVPGLTLAAPAMTPGATAQVVNLTTPHLTLAAPSLIAGTVSSVALSKPTLTLSAPALTPQVSVQNVPLTTPQITFAAPSLTVHNDAVVSLSTAHLALQAFPVNPTTINPVYISPWYGNSLSPLESDFEGPAVP